MAAKLSVDDFVMLSGPPYSGTTEYFRQHLSEDYVKVSPPELYATHPDFGMRDICLHICQMLKKGEKVVIDDENELQVTRQAYFTAVRKKFPRCKMRLIQIRPQYGEVQCLWAQQFALASMKCSDTAPSRHIRIQKWFQKSKSPQAGHDNVSIQTEMLPLVAKTNYKLEVPALFLQWEALNTDNKNTSLVAAICRKWTDVNRCGRIIVICDGKNVSKGLLTQQEENFSVKTFMKAVVQELNVPVYVLQMTDLSVSGPFSVPPEPGILAFLQKRHCLDLHCRATQYIYTSASHKAMAEVAGVRHVKISQVLHNPNRLVSGQSSATPRIPDVLQRMVVSADPDAPSAAEIPLYMEIDTMTDGHMKEDLPGACTEAIFASNINIILKYQKEYATHATRVNESGSHIQEVCGSQWSKSPGSAAVPATSRDDRAFSLSSDSSSGSATSVRDLPSWMLRKPSKGLTKQDSTSSSDESSVIKKTAYMMTEKELMETAKLILKEAGREHHIEVLEKRARDKELDTSLFTELKERSGKNTQCPQNTGEMSARRRDLGCDKPTLSEEMSSRKGDFGCDIIPTLSDEMYSKNRHLDCDISTLSEETSSRKKDLEYVQSPSGDRSSLKKKEMETLILDSVIPPNKRKCGVEETEIDELDDPHIPLDASRRTRVTAVLDSLFD